MFALMHGDLSRAAQNAVELARLTREHDLRLWRAFGVFLEGFATAQSSSAGGLDAMRDGAELLREQNILIFDGLLKIALAGAEARAGDVDRALATLDEAVATSERIGHRTFDAELHRVRGEMLVKRDSANPVPAEQAFQTAIAVSRRQGTRSFELRAALSLAKLHQSTGRPADAHAVLAPALEGFTPTPEMPEIAQAQALLAALAKDERVGELLEKQQARAKIHVDYARAMQWAKGFGAEETRAALERAHEFVAPTPGHPDYWSLTYGRFAVSLLRGEFRAAQEIAETYLRQAEVERRPDHAVNARRLLGTVKLELGAFSESRREFEELLANWDEERDKYLRLVTGADVLCVGWVFMAQLMIILGEVEVGVHMSEDAIRRAESLGDFGSLAFATGQSLQVLAICGRIEAVLRRAEAFEANASEKGARLWESTARGWASWARGLVARDAAPTATEFRDIIAAKRERLERHGQYMWQGLLAQLQGKAGAIDDALASIAEGLALAEQTGGHRADSFLHRVGGDILAERDPVAAEAAYREAARIAREQGARTFELQAAHALAKLLIAGEHPAEAHAVLAPALEGFAPTPEMPEIAEAQALLAALAETTEVKGAEAQRQRRLHLQTAYGQAVMWSKGFAAEETKDALARIMEFAAKSDFAERFAAGHGQWVTAVTLGELRRARELASAFLKEAEDVGRVVEAGVARRGLAVACYRSGDFSEARTHCERALAACDPEREKETRERFTDDTGPVVMSVLAMTMWQLGEVERARELIDEVNQRARDLGHAPSMAHPLLWTSRLETLRGDAAAALSAAEALEALCREHGMPFWRVRAELNAGWARGRLHNAAAGAEDLRRALAAAADQGMMGDAWYYAALLAELEAQTLGADSALERIDEALTLARQVDNRCDLPFPHIMRGELLLKRDPSNPAPAEEAFRAALDVAKEQGARSWGLRAALSLAKLYRLTGRPAEAHAVLAPALEGFAPTPEMPEIAEAQALLVAIEAGRM
jgi:predicted ATPase